MHNIFDKKTKIFSGCTRKKNSKTSKKITIMSRSWKSSTQHKKTKFRHIFLFNIWIFQCTCVLSNLDWSHVFSLWNGTRLTHFFSSYSCPCEASFVSKLRLLQKECLDESRLLWLYWIFRGFARLNFQTIFWRLIFIVYSYFLKNIFKFLFIFIMLKIQSGILNKNMISKSR